MKAELSPNGEIVPCQRELETTNYQGIQILVYPSEQPSVPVGLRTQSIPLIGGLLTTLSQWAPSETGLNSIDRRPWVVRGEWQS
jgi:hypothetical protein